MAMSRRYKQQLTMDLIMLQGMHPFHGDMWIYQKTYFFITDNGGEINVEIVNSNKLPISIPIDIDQVFKVSPLALCSAVRDACLLLLLQRNEVSEPRDSVEWEAKLQEWLAWVRKHDEFWETVKE